MALSECDEEEEGCTQRRVRCGSLLSLQGVCRDDGWGGGEQVELTSNARLGTPVTPWASLLMREVPTCPTCMHARMRGRAVRAPLNLDMLPAATCG